MTLQPSPHSSDVIGCREFVALFIGVMLTLPSVLQPAVGALRMSLSTVVVAHNAPLLRRTNFSPFVTPKDLHQLNWVRALYDT